MNLPDIVIPDGLHKYKLAQIVRVIDFLNAPPRKREHSQLVESILDMVDLIHAVTDIPKETLRRYDSKTNLLPAYEAINKHLRHKITTPKKEVTIEGVTYVFDQKISSETWNAGRLIDADNRSIDADKEPEYICALCYLEKGKKYGYPPSEGGCMELEERAKIMREHFSGEDYLNLHAFFLQKFWLLSPGFSCLQIAKAQLLRKEAEKKTQPFG